MDELVVGGATAVWIGRNADAATVLGDAAAGRVAVLTQPGVPGGIAGRLAAELGGIVIAVPDGAAAKSLQVAERVLRRLQEAGLERGDLILGVGGGSLTDLAGFVAAVYLRGVRVHYLPTTLVGAVDAAIGGKTGLDLAGKNQIGVFRHPARVVIDTDVLGALPAPLLRDGAAEALKAGLVGDPGLVDLLEQRGVEAPLDEVVRRAVRVKAEIVGRDFTETGERAHLNYGHTVGHAIETLAGWTHGRAVAVGMVAAGRASALVAGFGAESRQRDVIASLGLPVRAPGVEADAARALIARDKKRSGGSARMVLLAEIGRPVVAAVDDATVTAALRAVDIGGGT